jgi:hypothetical protein
MFYHPWIWINQPQHSSAVQAVTSVIATAAAIGAAYFAYRAYASAAGQLVIAREQLNLQRNQFDIETKRSLAERDAVRAKAKIAYESTKAQEDSERPRFKYQLYDSGRPFCQVDFVNIGETAATDVEFRSAANHGLLKHEDIISPGKRAGMEVAKHELFSTGVAVKFRTSFGSTWKIVLKIDASFPASPKLVEDVKRVVRPYVPTDEG